MPFFLPLFLPLFLPASAAPPVVPAPPPAISRTTSTVPQPTAPSPSRKDTPNIIVIVSDDQGYADVGFHRSTEMKTPNLDALAASGIICTAGYVTFPVCSPSRAGLLTGRHGARFGYNTNPSDDAASDLYSVGLPLSERTLPQALIPRGYATGMVGKWHLGSDSPHQPNRRGFQEFFGFLWGGHRFLDWKEDPANAYNAPILRNTEPVPGLEKRYLTEVFSEEACGFVERHRSQPFFLYLAYNAPHEPLQATPKYLDRFPALTGRRRTYAAMVSALDDGVGQLRDKLKALGLEKDTIIFFFSDNGGPITANASSNAPLRGQKSQVWEGGIRVPYVVSWPGTLPSGARYTKPVSTMDILPTMLGALKIDTDEMTSHEGVDLLPFLTGKTTAAPHDRLYWRQNNGAWAIREGRWKLVRDPKKQRFLYDIEADIRESNDLSAAHPDVVERLAKAWNAWNASNAEYSPWQQQKSSAVSAAVSR